MSHIKTWIQASRISSQSYIFLPILLGQSCWAFLGNPIDWRAFALIQLFGLFDQLFIVYLNDYADRSDDIKNAMPTMFSGGSRVLVDKLLEPKQLKAAGILMGILAMACAFLFTVLYGYFLMIPLMALGLSLLWMYSFKPLRFSYRGGGEYLQTIGTAILLPLLGYYAQSGTISGFPWPVLLVLMPTSLACAIATAVPDSAADATYGKRTIPVTLGLERATWLIIALNALSIAVYYSVSEPIANAVPGVLFKALPVASLIGTFAFRKAKPGTPGVAAFGLFAILTTLSLTSAMALGFFGR